MSDHRYFVTLIWQIADLLRGPYRPLAEIDADLTRAEGEILRLLRAVTA
jgi:hypothetical protein